MTAPTCRHCGQPSPYADLCAKCTRTLRVGLRRVAELYADLDTTVRAGATRYTDPSPTRGYPGSSRLPFDARFAPVRRTDAHGHLLAPETRSPLADLEDEVRNTLTTWVRLLVEEHLVDPPRHDRRVALVALLASRVDVIARQPWSADLLRDVLGLERKLRRAVDRPGDSWYAGVCGAVIEPERPHDARSCGCACHVDLPGITPQNARNRPLSAEQGVGGHGDHQDTARAADGLCDVPGGCSREQLVVPAVVCDRPLWASPGVDDLRCRGCGTVWTSDERHEWVLYQARERLMTVGKIWELVHLHVDDTIAEHKLLGRIRQWKHRGRIQSHGTRVVDGRSLPLYLAGDVLDLLDTDAQDTA